jgi:glycosyltransferase involved in cell wall biosynthesis
VLLTGTIPRADGVGVERRAAETLRALAALGRVRVVHVGGATSRAIVPDSMRALSSCWQSVRAPWWPDLGRWLRRLYLRAPRAPLPPAPLRAALERALRLEGSARVPLPPLARARHVHVFRLPLLPLAGQLGASVSLDLDDVESDTLGAIAELAAQQGDHGLAFGYRALAQAAGRFEARWLPTVARLGVCSHEDRARIQARFPHARVVVVPNVYRAHEPRARPDDRALRMLFVGALGYYPNVDAVRFAVDALLPRLRARSSQPLELHVVGRGLTRSLRRELARVPELHLHGDVSALGPLYARSHVALCPVRAGGGTRIKILEAFAHGVPVVATRAGAAGLEVAHGRELYLADEPDAFAEGVGACVADSEALVARARAFVLGHHQPRCFERALAELVGD